MNEDGHCVQGKILLQLFRITPDLPCQKRLCILGFLRRQSKFGAGLGA